MIRLIVSSPSYRVVNDVMWKVITHCNKHSINIQKISWANIQIRTDHCKIQFCLDAALKRYLKNEHDAVFNSSAVQVKRLLEYILEVEKKLKCDLKKVG